MDDYDKLSAKCAEIVADRINRKPDGAFGFATGGTPVGTYKALIGLYNAGKVDFSRITAFNLDEYYPILKSNGQSYDYFMWENLFSRVNVRKEALNIPDGEAKDPEGECRRYDRVIEETGGIDLQILGVGNNGHIGFNEPADVFSRGAVCVSLAESTVDANARFFERKEDVPRRAITMGVGSILKSREILLIASGKSKAGIIKEALRGPITPGVPASILQSKRDVIVALDKEAASEL
jgi:glucosamine-6-phosphate deaminase